MDKPVLIKAIIRNRKEIYYPLFALICTFLLYLVLSFFIEFADSHTIYPFLFFTLDLFIIKYTVDFFSEVKENNLNNTSMFILYVSLIIILSLFVILGLVFLLSSDIFYMIPISIHFISIFMIYYFLHREVVKYYEKKENN